jgi:predicted RNase H-like HicB family nuclease/predicted RNA binding protein YcfA (HicA-like mRNA interferase family)
MLVGHVSVSNQGCRSDIFERKGIHEPFLLTRARTPVPDLRARRQSGLAIFWLATWQSTFMMPFCRPVLTWRPAGRRAGIRFYSFEIVIEREAEDEGYSAYSPSLPGCFSNGRTIEETKRNMREAIQQHVAGLLAQGEPVPQNERLVHVEELSIGPALMARMPQVSARGLVRFLKKQGFVEVRQSGSHLTLWHDERRLGITGTGTHRRRYRPRAGVNPQGRRLHRRRTTCRSADRRWRG